MHAQEYRVFENVAREHVFLGSGGDAGVAEGREGCESGESKLQVGHHAGARIV